MFDRSRSLDLFHNSSTPSPCLAPPKRLPCLRVAASAEARREGEGRGKKGEVEQARVNYERGHRSVREGVQRRRTADQRSFQYSFNACPVERS